MHECIYELKCLMNQAILAKKLDCIVFLSNLELASQESQIKNKQEHGTASSINQRLAGINDTRNLLNCVNGESATSLGQGEEPADTSGSPGTLFVISF